MVDIMKNNPITEEILIFDTQNVIHSYLFSGFKSIPFTNVYLSDSIIDMQRKVIGSNYSAVVLHLDSEETKDQLFDNIQFIRSINGFVVLIAVSYREELLLDQRVIDFGFDDIFVLPMSANYFLFRLLMIISKSRRCSGITKMNNNSFLDYRKEIEKIKNKLKMVK